MDAHLFRRICDDLLPALLGARIEKIHQLADNITVFTLYGLLKSQNDHLSDNIEFLEKKQFLILKEGKKPLLFLSNYRPRTNEHPPAKIMRLRKYLAGKRISKIHCNWLQRKIYFELFGDIYFSLDLKNGIEILNYPYPLEQNQDNTKDVNLSMEPSFNSLNYGEYWPDFDDILNFKDNQEIWQKFPIITPLLRKVIPFLDNNEAKALYADLQYGGGDIIIYEEQINNLPNQNLLNKNIEILPFHLPKQLEELNFNKENYKVHQFENSFSALLFFGELYLTHFDQKLDDLALKSLNSKNKKLDNLLNKLDLEQERLQKMQDQKAIALILQANLYLFDSNKKEKTIKTIDFEGKELEIKLDPTKTIKDNMEYLFHQAKRGQRGLEHLVLRKEQVLAQKQALNQEVLQSHILPQKDKKTNKTPILKSNNKIKFNKGNQFKDSEIQKLPKPENKTKFPSQVQVFTSKDGFTMLRGRDSKGNALVLKMASPHDYWIHTADGPSAHVIIRKNHPNQEIPKSTLQEAGILAVEKSGQKNQSKAMVQYSLAKNIRLMKNAPSGLVHIDKSEGTFWVEIT